MPGLVAQTPFSSQTLAPPVFCLLVSAGCNTRHFFGKGFYKYFTYAQYYTYSRRPYLFLAFL